MHLGSLLNGARPQQGEVEEDEGEEGLEDPESVSLLREVC